MCGLRLFYLHKFFLESHSQVKNDFWVFAGDRGQGLLFSGAGTSSQRNLYFSSGSSATTASPCALDVAPLAYATAISVCAKKEKFLFGFDP
ncbi:hypothetical protein L1987_64155 [Smallanthus sonchifolius]|uniref:Uncharacterized protein n=1 Tax=Smallanthus sonchifolius TaxID=185202 RepID=A0ACB9CFA3_9ASTR|nr:hypothetical protein L1987_64155 [Smallanthus sonchifolius]